MYRLGNPLLERTIVIGRLYIRAMLWVKRHHMGPNRETEMAHRMGLRHLPCKAHADRASTRCRNKSNPARP